VVKVLKIDELARKDHYYLAPDDACYYLREYTAGRDYSFGQTNNLISNFKKSPLLKDQAQYQYKRQAIRQIVAELNESVPATAISGITLVPIPPSKAKDHPEYDDRIQQVLDRFHRGEPTKDVADLITQKATSRASHAASGNRLRPEELLELYQVDQRALAVAREGIILVDDLLTTGAHFRAAKLALQRIRPELWVGGLFIARRIFPSSDAGEAFADI